ncbi:MAG: hypothetical protein ABH950_02835 [Candidatus Altiarchaeota archaeon]
MTLSSNISDCRILKELCCNPPYSGIAVGDDDVGDLEICGISGPQKPLGF